MKCSDVMTTHPVSCTPDDTIETAAQLMKIHDIGVIPVVSQTGSLAGIVTDRDIAMRTEAEGIDPRTTPIERIMTRDVVCCLADDDLVHAFDLLTIAGVRRIPIVDAQTKLAGMLSKTDLARKLSREQVSVLVANASPAGTPTSGWFAPLFAAACAGAAGAGLMYVFDPIKGRSRRAVLRDKAKHVIREAVKKAEGARNDAVNRVCGLMAETKARMCSAQPADDILVQRLRAKLGRIVTHPHEVSVAAEHGVVTLSGILPVSEIRRTLEASKCIRGVNKVINQMAPTEMRREYTTASAAV